jgi:hypothetical protein
MGMMPTEKRIPFSGLIAHVIFQEDSIGRFQRLSAEGHLGIVWRIVTLLGVAPFTGGNQIRPGILTAFCPWNYVIDGEFFTCAAILTLVIIAFEYILPGKINALVRGVNISVEADHRRHWVAVRDGVQLMPVCGSYHFALVQKNEYERALDRAHHEGAVILI